MIRSSFLAACLATCGLTALPTASADPPRSCPTEFPHPLPCGGDNFYTVTLLNNGGDPCESLLCLPIVRPLEPVLKCVLVDSGIICEVWPRNPPPENDQKPPDPILYRWAVHGDISGANTWSENYAAMFRCTAGTESIGIIMVEIMSPYGLASSTSAAVSCAPLRDFDPGELADPGVPIVPPGDPQF